uniref:Uncharacterized protein n=1 Tax=Candidatus Kentrum sp. DK TaxID=2126562 RepID=A0A450T6T2_9GAMM|nr:MAG: hypothetical protein BECKDK2373B_GA0170837_11115 [Candidatus Kentron sp. DK]
MAGVVAPTRRREQGNRNKRFDWAISDYRLTRAGQPNNNALIVNAYHLSMGGRGSRLALFYRYFRLGGSLALPVRLLRCLIADLNLRIAGNHYWPINELLFGCSGYPGPISAFPQQNHPKSDRLLVQLILNPQAVCATRFCSSGFSVLGSLWPRAGVFCLLARCHALRL